MQYNDVLIEITDKNDYVIVGIKDKKYRFNTPTINEKRYLDLKGIDLNTGEDFMATYVFSGIPF